MHEQVRKFLSNFDYWLNEQTAEMVQKYLSDYITQQEDKDKVHDDLKRDVKRYFELWEQAREKWGNGLNDVEAYEATKLHIKLSKVGREE